MPLTTKTGLEVALVRPELQPIRRKKDQPSRRKPREITLKNLTLPKVKFASGRSKYKTKKCLSSFSLPPLVLLTLRGYIADGGFFSSDVVTDILIFYFDAHFPGWDSNFPERIVALDRPRGKVPAREKELIVGTKQNEMYSPYHRKPSQFRVTKIEQLYTLPEPVYVTIRSIAKAQNCPISDIATLAMMYFFDETLPGWDLIGDPPDVPETP